MVEKSPLLFLESKKNGPLDHNSLFYFQAREKTVR